MKETVAKQKVVIETTVTSVTCNCCGHKVSGRDADYNNNITSLRVDFGFGSKFDTDQWSMDICDSCLENWVGTFKYPVDKKEY